MELFSNFWINITHEGVYGGSAMVLLEVHQFLDNIVPHVDCVNRILPGELQKGPHKLTYIFKLQYLKCTKTS